MNWVSIGSGINSLLPVQCQAITWTNADFLSIGPLGKFKKKKTLFMKIHLKLLSAKWQPFCPGGDELIVSTFNKGYLRSYCFNRVGFLWNISSIASKVVFLFRLDFISITLALAGFCVKFEDLIILPQFLHHWIENWDISWHQPCLSLMALEVVITTTGHAVNDNKLTSQKFSAFKCDVTVSASQKHNVIPAYIWS